MKTIDLIGLFFAILEKFWLVVICALVGALLMGWMAGRSGTTYTATAKLFIVDTSSGSINISNLQLGTVLTLDYQEVFKTWEVHEMVIEELDLPYSYAQMQSMLTVTKPQDTRVLYITVAFPDAKMAADIANAYAKAAKTFIINTMRGEEPSDFSIALEPSTGYRVSKASRMVMGFMLGSVLAVGLITLLFVLDNRPRSPEDIETYGGVPTLAVFPERPRKKIADRKLDKDGPKAESAMPMLEIVQFPECDFVSHEAVCVLNLSGETAHIDLTIFFEDAEPLRGFHAVCENERTNHIRLDKQINDEGKPIPRNKPYAILVESDRPIVAQCSRLDVSQPEYALMTTIAY